MKSDRKHLDRVLAAFKENAWKKYMKGQAEHGEDLATKESIVWLLKQIEDEAIDLYVYVRTLRERILGKE